VVNLKDVIDTTKIAGKAVFASAASVSVTAQTGITSSGSSKTLTFGGLKTTSAGALAAVAALNIATTATATSLSAIDTAIAAVSTEVAKVGGYQNSIQFASDYVDSTVLNKSIQLSQVMDADIAQEASNLAAARIRQDASTAVLAQANSMSRTVADFLLKGAMG
jgi:flagellin